VEQKTTTAEQIGLGRVQKWPPWHNREHIIFTDSLLGSDRSGKKFLDYLLGWDRADRELLDGLLG